MKLLSLLFLILLLFTTEVFAQNYDIHHPVDFYNLRKEVTDSSPKILEENDIEGSPYLNKEFVEGTIYTNQKYQYNNIPIRYNIYTDELEYRTPDNQISTLTTPQIVEKADFGDYSMRNIFYLRGKKINHGFFKILEEGPVSLYSRYKIVFVEAKEAAAFKDPEPPKFVTSPDTYYLKIGQKAAVKIENKKELIELFPDHKKEVAAFIKQNQTKLNKPENLVALVEYYNSL